jgi:hypothetical protein
MATRQGQAQASLKKASAGDAAVDGLFSGLAAGLLMMAYLVLVGLFMGENPGIMLARFSASETITPWMGLLSHLAVSGIYGLIYGLLALSLARLGARAPASWIAGLVYGLLLFLAAWFVILPGTDLPLRDIPAVHLTAAHLLYGWLLGTLMAWTPKA